MSPSSPSHPFSPLLAPAPPLPTCLTQDSQPLRGSDSPDTSKTFPLRGWGTPGTPCSPQGSASKTKCNGGLPPFREALSLWG